jgi:hypothetical protein
MLMGAFSPYLAELLAEGLSRRAIQTQKYRDKSGSLSKRQPHLSNWAASVGLDYLDTVSASSYPWDFALARFFGGEQRDVEDAINRATAHELSECRTSGCAASSAPQSAPDQLAGLGRPVGIQTI